MTDAPTLELPTDGDDAARDESADVPPPVPPHDPDAWYAPDVRAQYRVADDVVATVRETEDGFAYDVREPGVGPDERAVVDRVRAYFEDANLQPPRTREAARDRLAEGFTGKHERVVSRLVDLTPAAERRVRYHLLRDLRCLGDLTPLALDDRVQVADVEDDALRVHTDRFAPATTSLDADVDGLGRFASERLARYTVSFETYEIPVVLYREHAVGGDAFNTRYAVLEPDLLPGDRELVDACEDRVWEHAVTTPDVDRVSLVRDRAERYLERALNARSASAWLDAARHRVREALAERDLVLPPVDERYSGDRLEDLVYYVLRDYVGHGELTVPIHDPNLEDVEANRVGERVKVVPRSDLHDGRVPTNLAFEDEASFVNVVTQLAASDGVELTASNPSAKVNLDVGTDETVRCAVALPVVSEGGPHVSIRKQAADSLSPVDLLERDALPADLVALLWMLYEHHGVVLFSGPTGVGKTTLMNAHMPFVPFDHRPVSIDEGSREVSLPHETGVSLTTRDHQTPYKRVTMADLMTETNYLNPDVEVIAEVNTPESFATFAETLNTGHGVVGTTHAESVEKLVNRVVEQGLPSYLLAELDLVVFPRHVDGERYVGRVVEFVDEATYESCTGPRGSVEKDDATVYYNEVLSRTPDGTFELAYHHPDLHEDATARACEHAVFETVARRTDRTVDAVEDEFHRKHRYVQHFVRSEVRDVDELFSLVADLRTDAAATVAARASGDTGPDAQDGDCTDAQDGYGSGTPESDGGWS
ncbi:type II/IV secretion system ATPase subunit [Halorubellus sp. JP-L1]|uniref:type II/IV secretion system ATPase subunit n=1 Tax=Halorubellus sp. JP-L1 TaxID=2715753 RepID=UPI00140A4748|nr:type II/IV secretion system ATPase subunit [Halorubellus sp. JP-L1]NHN42224.1 type II/IV secretion system ATPase subunit [Halorubellus sp. JP-L1]